MRRSQRPPVDGAQADAHRSHAGSARRPPRLRGGPATPNGRQIGQGMPFISRRYCRLRVAPISEHTGEVAGLPVFWRSAPGSGTPTLYLHGVPTNSDDWLEFLRRGGGLAPDLPGFGRSGKPGHFDYSIEGYASFIEGFLDSLEVERVRMVVHDWGAVGLAFAQLHPERVQRLVIVDAVPLLRGYRWHRIARVWRTPVLGELAMGSMSARVLRRLSSEANAAPGPLPEAMLESIGAHLDHGTQRAILRLYRSAPPATLARAGEQLHRLRMPALVVWGERDPYIPDLFADLYAQALGSAELLRLPDAGHWPWLDRPELIEQILTFLGVNPPAASTVPSDSRLSQDL